VKYKCAVSYLCASALFPTCSGCTRVQYPIDNDWCGSVQVFIFTIVTVVPYKLYAPTKPSILSAYETQCLLPNHSTFFPSPRTIHATNQEIRLVSRTKKELSTKPSLSLLLSLLPLQSPLMHPMCIQVWRGGADISFCMRSIYLFFFIK